MSRRSHVPAYRLHKQSGQAIVTLTDAFGNRRDVLLGKHDTPESREEYGRVIAEWEAAGRRLPCTPAADQRLSVNELLVLYWKWAEDYYNLKDEKKGHGYAIRDALRIVKELYGTTPAEEFGPLALKACRQRMIGKDWSRSYVNSQVDRIRRVFRWAAEEELLPASVYQNLQTVAGLRQGKTEARETKPVRPVAAEVVEATLPYLPVIVRAMVRLQLVLGRGRPRSACSARSTSTCATRPAGATAPAATRAGTAPTRPPTTATTGSSSSAPGRRKSSAPTWEPRSTLTASARPRPRRTARPSGGGSARRP
jgi:hypothetical protein